MPVDHALLERIWDVQHLGRIHSVTQPTRGMVNHCLIVNDAEVIRFDFLGSDDPPTRYLSEKIAYDRLRNSGVPVPEVRVLDTSQTIAPCDYVILSKLPGTTVIDSWSNLSASEKDYLAYTTGRVLALIHNQTFPRFGRLRTVGAGGFDQWYAYVNDFFRRFSAQAVAIHTHDVCHLLYTLATSQLPQAL